MSTFDGVLEEYPLISIDCFLEPKNYSSTVYFLSHCHKDHMHGLNHQEYYRLLNRRQFSKIYLSDVSSHLLKNDERYQHLTDYLVELRIEEPTLINIYDELGSIHSKVTVTLLTAGHCPGSVMFYFEGDNGNVLYTGDFRLPVGSAKRLMHLHEKNGHLKPLKSLYIDTTFCKESCLYIPSREECLNEILSIVEPWLSKGSNYIVYFLCPYELAYEFVFVELHKRLGLKIHVKYESERKYLGIKQLESAITTCASEARIHACIFDPDNRMAKLIKKFYPYYESPCGFTSSNEKPIYVKKIKPSAMFFTKNNFSSISDFNDKTSLHRVYYSTHPSLSEIQDMVFYLKPKRVFPNVVHGQTMEEILDLIFKSHKIASAENESERSESLSPLGILKCPSPKGVSSQESDSLPFFDDCYTLDTDKKNITRPSAKRSQSYNLNVDTDYENTKELESMLREEIYSQKIENRNCSGINKSPLKWENPVVSSDEEIFESSSDSSIEDNDDSDTFGEASQETIIKSSLEEKDPIKDRTECIQPSYCIDKKSQQTSIKSPSDDNEKINDVNMCKTQLNNCVDSSPKSTESASLINEQYVSYLCNSNYNINNNNACLPEKILSKIDKEYFKISEVDNGVSALSPHTDNTNNLKFNRKSPTHYAHCKDNFTNVHFIGVSNSECENYNLTSSSNVHQPHFSSSEQEKTDDKLKTCENYLMIHSAEKTTAASPPRYLIPIDGCDIHCDNKDDVTASKSSDFMPYNCVNFVQYPICTKKVESRSQCNLKSEVSSIKTNGHSSKSFLFVKKIDSSSESEEEYNFKYVIKNSSKNSESSKNFNQKKNKSCSSDSVVNHNKHIQLKSNTSQIQKNLATIGTISANDLNQKSSVVDASDKIFNPRQVYINNQTDSKCDDESENESKDINKDDLYNSLKYQSQFHKDSDNKNMPSKVLNNNKDQESIFKNTENINFVSEAVQTSTAVQNVSAVVKTYQNKSLNDNVIKSLDQELIDLSSDQSSGEIVTVNPTEDTESKILFNVKNFTSQNITFTENRHGNKPKNSPTNSKLICISNKENTSNVVSNSMYPETAVKYNLTDNLDHNIKNGNSLQSRESLVQELIDLSSDQSSGEIVTVNPTKDTESRILFNVNKISSQKVSYIEDRPGNKQQNSPTHSKLICTSNKENTCNDIGNSMYSETTVKHNLTDDLDHNIKNRNFLQSSSSTKISGDSAEILSKNQIINKQKSISENKVLEKISSTWEIKTITPSSSGSNVIVEEILSSSDLDDSPSLIAPNVPKTSNSSNFFSGSFCDLKRRKIEWEKSNLSNKNKDCDKSSSNICDNFVVDSDSTPELFESNFSKNEYPLKQAVPEIIIDDDD